jgi:AraC-like DNA-binding protein
MQRVRGFLSAKPGCYPPASEVARALRTSPRSLRRGLQRMSTSYQELLDETRHDDARRLLETTRLSMEEVARKLGFADVRSFRRAFKRWTGVSPGSYRELRTRDPNASV